MRVTARANTLMTRHWGSSIEISQNTNLVERLRQLAESEVIVVDDAYVLKRLLSQGLSRADFDDPTGFEALTNKFHISDYLQDTSSSREMLQQGVQYAALLAERLSHLAGSFRVVLSRDPDSDRVTVRFFGVRPNAPWGPEDPDEYS